MFTYALSPPVTLGTWSASSSMPPTALSPRTTSSLLASVAGVPCADLAAERRSGLSLSCQSGHEGRKKCGGVCGVGFLDVSEPRLAGGW